MWSSAGVGRSDGLVVVSSIMFRSVVMAVVVYARVSKGSPRARPAATPTRNVSTFIFIGISGFKNVFGYVNGKKMGTFA